MRPHNAFHGNSRGKYRTYRYVKKKPLQMPYIVSMVKCEYLLYWAGKRPHLLFFLPDIPFSPERFSSCLSGNHITTPCFFHSLRGRDGARAAASASHTIQLQPLFSSPSSSSSSSRFLSCPSFRPALTSAKSLPCSATVTKLGSRDPTGP